MLDSAVFDKSLGQEQLKQLFSSELRALLDANEHQQRSFETFNTDHSPEHLKEFLNAAVQSFGRFHKTFVMINAMLEPDKGRSQPLGQAILSEYYYTLKNAARLEEGHLDFVAVCVKHLCQ